MPDTDSPGPGSQGPNATGSSSGGPSSGGPSPGGLNASDTAEPGLSPAGSSRNLPVPVPAASPPGETNGESWFTRALRALFWWRPETFRADLRSALEGRAADIGLSPRESAMLRNILGLRERRAVDVMVPRADIVAVQKEIPLGDLMKVFESAAHSRLVVYDDTLDDAIGMVHIRDLIAYMTTHAAASAKANTKRKKPFPADLDLKAIDLSVPLFKASIVREMLFVPPSMPVTDLLARMQTSRIHLALVVDEYGGSDGVVSIEDIVEQIVGEIADEHDEDDAPRVVRQPDGSFLADARANLEDVTAIVGPEFEVGEVANDVDTLGGYIATQIGRVPLRGELVSGPGRFEIEVLDADPRRVKKLKIFRSPEPAERRDPAPLPRATPGPTEARPPRPDLPANRDASVKLSADDPPAKAPRTP
jgi:CBS domain containing-hemolysin-like protein